MKRVPTKSRLAAAMACTSIGMLLTGLTATQALAQAASAADNETFARGRILVMPRAGLGDVALGRIVKDHGASGAKRVGKTELRIVNVPPGQERNVQERLALHPHIRFAELDQKVATTFTPNDPYYGSEWHTSKIGAATAWDLSQGGGVTIAILDTGVDGTHPDLSAQMVAGWNFYDNNSNASAVTDHGTWVAGTAGATSNNGKGVAAVAGAAKIMPLRVTDTSGVGYWSMIAQGITYAADRGARVANASFEGLLQSSSVLSAANYMRSKGGLVVISAGNTGSNPNYTPSSSVITVSATDANDQITSWSSYGSFVSIAAPGNYIYTTGAGGSYVQGIGTSFASPIVAATVALMMAANPSLPNTQIESLLYSSATDLGAAGRDNYYGYGRVNAGAAVQAALAAVSNVDTQPPQVAVTSPAAGVTVSGLVAIGVSASDNVGVSKVELRVNGTLIATDSTSPFAFSWDSTSIPNGSATLTAKAFDAAGNTASSSSVTVTVSNPVVADTTPPAVTITNPSSSQLKGAGTISVASAATDNSGSAGILQQLYIDNVLVASGSGGSLSYSWNLKRVSSGAHTLKAVATDAAGNSTFTSKTVYK